MEIEEKLRKSRCVIESIGEMQAGLTQIADLMGECLKEGGKIISCGNGGSSAQAMHLTGELAGRFAKERRGLASVTLGVNSTLLTCIGNDYGFESVFSRELESIGQEKDLLIAFTTSGKSKNVAKAIEVAKRIGMKTICFTSEIGANLIDCDVRLGIKSTSTARIQEAHLVCVHLICEHFDNIYGEH